MGGDLQGAALGTQGQVGHQIVAHIRCQPPFEQHLFLVVAARQLDLHPRTGWDAVDAAFVQAFHLINFTQGVATGDDPHL